MKVITLLILFALFFVFNTVFAVSPSRVFEDGPNQAATQLLTLNMGDPYAPSGSDKVE